VTFAEWTRPPLVPVIVNVRVRFATLGEVATVSTEVPEFTTDAGLNLTVERCGAPLRDKLTVPEKPAPAVIATV
jgi:hypothetical protein